MHVAGVAALPLVSVDACRHHEVIWIGEFVGGHHPWPQAGAPVLALRRTQPNLHFTLLNIPRAEVVEDGVARDIVACILRLDIAAGAPDDRRQFKLLVEFFREARP